MAPQGSLDPKMLVQTDSWQDSETQWIIPEDINKFIILHANPLLI